MFPYIREPYRSYRLLPVVICGDMSFWRWRLLSFSPFFRGVRMRGYEARSTSRRCKIGVALAFERAHEAPSDVDW